MTKMDLVRRIAHTGTMSQEKASVLLDAVFTEVRQGIKTDGRFGYPGFGTFRVRKRPARTGRHPRTGAKLKIKASKTVSFLPAPTLKKSL